MALTAATSTAPADTSLATRARGSSSSVMMSTTCSMAVLNISVMITNEMATSSAMTSSRVSAKNSAANSTSAAMAKWIHMLRSVRSAWTMPSKAKLKLWSRLPRRRDNDALPLDQFQHLGLAERHLAGVRLVVVAQQVQGAVRQEDGELERRRQVVAAPPARSARRAQITMSPSMSGGPALPETTASATSPRSGASEAATSARARRVEPAPSTLSSTFSGSHSSSGKLSTSVTSSLPRYSRLISRMRRSPTKVMSTSAPATPSSSSTRPTRRATSSSSISVRVPLETSMTFTSRAPLAALASARRRGRSRARRARRSGRRAPCRR